MNFARDAVNWVSQMVRNEMWFWISQIVRSEMWFWISQMQNKMWFLFHYNKVDLNMLYKTEPTLSGKYDYLMLLHVRLWSTQILMPQLCFFKRKTMLTDPCLSILPLHLHFLYILCVYTMNVCCWSMLIRGAWPGVSAELMWMMACCNYELKKNIYRCKSSQKDRICTATGFSDSAAGQRLKTKTTLVG